jgi:carboxyl-terminal processing protease
MSEESNQNSLSKYKIKYMTKRRGLTGKGWLLAVLLTIVISVGFVAATTDRRNFEIVKNLDIFYTLFRELNSYYVDETNPEKLIKTGIDAMLESLDPYTTFIPESEMDDFRFMTTGEYAGIGALITKRAEYVVVSEPYEGFPAQESGLKAGDRILEIDGQDMKNKETSFVSDRLKGPAGTQVKVLVKRPGLDKNVEITINRRLIHINPVPYYGMLNDKTGIIILNNFTQDCSREVEKAFTDLRNNHNMSNLVLDLRGNPGGLMDESVKIANLFLPRGSEVVSTRGKVSQWDKTYRAPREPIDTIMPIAVLINRGSASASEIVAGALQDHDRALIIGQRSFGKGLVQTTRTLAYNSNLKVTTAKYYVPSGRSIQAVDYANRNEDGSVGLIPDSLMREFQTIGGRIVYDGGGISPDITVDQERFAPISIALMSQQTFFDFATEFATRNASIAEPTKFEISDAVFAEFKEYVAGLKDFKYESQSQDQLRKLKAAAQREEYYELAESAFKELELALEPNAVRDLDRSREEVSEVLAMEILRRYYYQKGAILHNITKDKEIKEAVRVLGNKSEYRDMLNGTILTHAGDKRN